MPKDIKGNEIIPDDYKPINLSDLFGGQDRATLPNFITKPVPNLPQTPEQADFSKPGILGKLQAILFTDDIQKRRLSAASPIHGQALIWNATLNTWIPGFAPSDMNGRFTAQIAAKTVLAFTVGAADASFLVHSNVLVTTSTAHSFGVTCVYTDESGTSRTLNLSFSNLAGTFLQTITNILGAGAYEGIPLRIRAKAGTTITFASSGTFTTVTYNIEAGLQQIN